MPRSLASLSAGSTLIPLADILALHRALAQARAGAADLDSFLREVLGTLCEHLRADGAVVGLCDAQHQCLERAITTGRAPSVLSGDSLDAALPCVRSQKDDDAEATALAWAERVAASEQLVALAGCPLLFQGEVIGLICLFGRAVARRPWQQEGLRAAALEISLAVAHLRLRQEVEEQLRQRNERWAALYELAVSLTSATDSDVLLDELVRRAVRLLRARGGSLSILDEVTGETVISVAYVNGATSGDMLGYRLPAGQGLAADVIRSGRTLRMPDYQFVAQSGNPLHLRTSVVAVPLFVQNEAVGVLAVGDNPLARRFTEDDVQTLELLAQAAGAVLEKLHGRAQEQALTIHRERARLARELHDGLAQNLASLLLKAELCHDVAQTVAPQLAGQIDALAEGIQQAVRETRAAIASLHEAPSDGERLMDALSLLAARFESQTRVPVALSWEGQAHRSFPAATHMALLRVAQEALANVRKHACARNVCAHLNASDPKIVELTVHDDGCGFDAQQMDATDDRQRFGLRGMRGRMEELGGSLTIDTARGCGTTVTAVVPLSGPGRQ